MRPLPTPRTRDGLFRNYSRTVSTRPTTWHVPTSEDEVCEVLAAGGPLHVVGAGHSFSGVAAPDGQAMTLDQLAGLVDTDGSTATVRAGMRLRDLSTALAKQGLSLPVVGSIQQQSVAGAIATGTHGSSLVHGNLASLVTRMRLAAPAGIVELTGGRLTGARVHLGVLGVVTELDVKVVPAFRLRQVIEHVPAEAIAERLETDARSAEYVKVWWLPGAKLGQLVRYERTTARAHRGPRVRRTVEERVLHRTVFPAMTRLEHRRPHLVPRLNDWLSKQYLGPLDRVGVASLMLNTALPMRHRETEAAIPLARAAGPIGTLIEELGKDARGATFPLEIRFVPADEAWLSPAYGDDTVQVGCYSTDGPRCDELFALFWDVMRPHGARPHWGKELDHDAAELKGLYPRWDDFQALREELDPDRVMSNAFSRSALG